MQRNLQILEIDSSRPADDGFVLGQTKRHKGSRRQPLQGLVRSTKSFFMKAFLPEGYPRTVSDDYLSYQIYDSLQAFCSTITGLLATRATFKRVGVGNAAATATSALINWVVQDLSANIGRILFTWSASTRFDNDVKQWRFAADILNDVGFLLELLAPYFPSHVSLMLAVCSTLFRALCGVAGGATKTNLSQHFALNSNMGDLAAKDGSQEMLVSLAAMSFGSILLSWIPDDAVTTWSLFVFMTCLHLLSNYFAVRGVVLDTWNEQRFAKCASTYLKTGKVPSVKNMAAEEEIFWNSSKTLDGWHITLGSRPSSVLAKFPRRSDESIVGQVTDLLLEATSTPHRYLICVNSQRKAIHIALHSDAKTRDILVAYYHALSIIANFPNNSSRRSQPSFHVLSPDTQKEFDKFQEQARQSSWTVDDDKCHFNVKPWRIQLKEVVDEIKKSN